MNTATLTKTGLSFAVGAMLLATGALVSASSHREAPMITGDPKVDATDLYAFVSPDKKDTVTLIANYIPMQEPAGGPNFYAFDDSARYEIHIDNDADAKEDITYRFEFDSKVRNNKSFLYTNGAVESLGDENWNAPQTYTLTRIEGNKSEVIVKDAYTTPANVGPKSIPDFKDLRDEAIVKEDGMQVFVGQIEDPFYVDLGATFDLLTIRQIPGNKGGGVDTLAGYNVSTLALQVPISELTDGDDIIGVWTTASRQSTRVLNSNPAKNQERGNWVQVSRLGSPLVNEVVVPLAAKDLFNASQPSDDAQFANGVTNPELGVLLNSLYKIKVPPQADFGKTDARDDLVAIFLTGIPDLTMPKNVKASEMLRLNTSIKPTGDENRMGVLGGDTQGYPNGRRLGDDVVDISLQAVAGAAYPLFHKDFTPDPLATKLGDGVDQNDRRFERSFPYVATPFGALESVPHEGAYQASTGMQNNDMGDKQKKIIELQGTIIKLLVKMTGGRTM